MTVKRTGITYLQYCCPIHFGKERQKYLFCPASHPKFINQKGCNVLIRLSPSIREQIDYGSVTFKEIQKKRSSVERVFSRLLAIAMQEPPVTGINAIRNYCTIAHIAVLLVALAANRSGHPDKIRFVRSFVPNFLFVGAKKNFVKPYIPDRKIPPFPLRTSPPSHPHLCPALAAPQAAISQAIDPCHLSFFGLDELSHPMGFHSQAFSDMSFHSHRPLPPLGFSLGILQGVLSEFPMRFRFLQTPLFHDHFRKRNLLVIAHPFHRWKGIRHPYQCDMMVEAPPRATLKVIQFRLALHLLVAPFNPKSPFRSSNQPSKRDPIRYETGNPVFPGLFVPFWLLDQQLFRKLLNRLALHQPIGHPNHHPSKPRSQRLLGPFPPRDRLPTPGNALA